MSLEEDYLMAEVRRLRSRIEVLEQEAGVLYGCRSCGTKFAVGLEACPHCSSSDIATDPKEVENLQVRAAESTEEERAPYEEWSYPELQAEAKRRDLSAGGSKDDLATRLYEDDEDREG